MPSDYSAEHADGAGRTWLGTRRHVIKGREDGGQFDVRYFEVSPGGFTALECHEHVHSVICIRGQGYAVVGQRVIDMEAYDHVYVPAGTPHQFVNSTDEPFGFLCVVDSQRDRPRALTSTELAPLRSDPQVGPKLRT